MRRTSPLAARITAALEGSEAKVSVRRLETWTLEGLGADERLPFDEQLAHYQVLADVAGPGRGHSADLAARRLAAHGFVCDRLRGALLREFNIDEVARPQTRPDLSTGESGDAGFAQIEEVARGIGASIEQLPLPLRSAVEKLRRNVYDSAARTEESGDIVFHSAIVNFMCLLLGGGLYDAQPIAAMFGVDQSEIDPEAIDFANRRLHLTVWDIDEAYRTASLTQVVTMACWLREHAHMAIPFLGDVTESQLDDLATLLSPYALHILSAIYAVLDDTDEVIATLELPASLTQSFSSQTALAPV